MAKNGATNHIYLALSQGFSITNNIVVHSIVGLKFKYFVHYTVLLYVLEWPQLFVLELLMRSLIKV